MAAVCAPAGVQGARTEQECAQGSPEGIGAPRGSTNRPCREAEPSDHALGALTFVKTFAADALGAPRYRWGLLVPRSLTRQVPSSEARSAVKRPRPERPQNTISVRGELPWPGRQRARYWREW